MKKIKVEYPSEEQTKNIYGIGFVTRRVNQAESIKVKVLTGLDKCEILCLYQTGMLPSEYQAKYHQAWNE